MAVAIRDTMPDVADADQVKAILRPGKAKGVNEEDLKFSGVMNQIDKLAAEGNGKVRKEDMMKFLTGEGFVKIKETVLKDYKPEPLSALESERLKLLESEDVKNPLGGIDEAIGEGAYNELMDLQNRRDKIDNTFRLQDEEVSTESMANKLFSGPGKDKQFKRMMDKAAHFGARAERLDQVMSKDRKNQPQYSGYQVPGGTKTEEIILSMHLPKKTESAKIRFPSKGFAEDFLGDVAALGYEHLEYGISDENPMTVNWEGSVPPKVQKLFASYGAAVRYEGSGLSGEIFHAPHYGKQGINSVVTARTNVRKDISGRTIRFMEEVQSDRHQQGRKYGYLGENVPSKKDYEAWDSDLSYRRNDPNLTENEKAIIERIDAFAESEPKAGEENKRVPDAPFRKDYPIQAFKRVLERAVDNGEKAVGWTKGATQFARWGSERVDWRKFNEEGVDGYLVEVKSFTRNSGPMKSEGMPMMARLVKTKEDLAATIVAQGVSNENNTFSDKVWKKMQETPSGTSMPRKEGMEKFYDEMLPTEIGKYMKQFGVKVKESAIMDNVSGEKVPSWSVDITPEVVAGVRKMQEIKKELSNYGKDKPKPGILGEEQKQFAPASPAERKDEEFWVSQRNPKAVKATENPLTEKLTIGLDVILKDKELAKKQADLVKQYPGFSPKSKTTDGILGEFVDHVKGNLLYLYDSFKPELREQAKKWYDGARKISEEWAGKYGTETRQNAGVLAVLSPQKDWFMNVSLADRVIDINTNKSKEVFSQEMFNWLKSDPKRGILVNSARKNLLGKRYSEVKDSFDKAIFLRAWDEVNNSRSFDVYNPDGKILGKKLNDDGTEGKVGWGSFSQIEKGISILENGARENIHNQLGEEHKVRNFFNNILQPNSKFGDVTIDTHAVAAGLLRPLSGGSTEVLHNLGGGPSSKIVGASGTYALFAEAYRNAAKERKVLPREMQSITWEAIRGLFKPTFKGQAKNKAFVDSVWSSYTKGRVKINEARNTISKFAGGIEDPSWARRSGQVPAKGGTTPNAGELPERSMAGQDGERRTGRGVRGTTPRNVQTQDLESAVKSRLIKRQLEAKK
jgi:hypothetical protein